MDRRRDYYRAILIAPRTEKHIFDVDGERCILSDGGLYYPVAELRRAAEAGQFGSAPVFDKHFFPFTYSAWDGPQEVGQVHQATWDAARNAVVGVLNIWHPPAQEALEGLARSGDLHTMALSIDVVGKVKRATMWRILKVNSVDFVDAASGFVANTGGRILEAVTCDTYDVGAIPRPVARPVARATTAKRERLVETATITPVR